MKECSILISSWCGHDALELCIESILKRTAYKSYRIVVCDSSPTDSVERFYLRAHRDDGNLELLESSVKLMHWQSLNKLLSYCTTEFACLLDSDVEILQGDWLSVGVNKIQSNLDVGAGWLVKGRQHIGKDYLQGPRYDPCCLFLNMPVYNKIRGKDDWENLWISINEYKHKDKFKKSSSVELSRWFSDCLFNQKLLTYDVGGRFTEKIIWENPHNFRVQELPPAFLKEKVRHYVGMSVHSSRLETSSMAPKFRVLKTHLQQLRGEVKC